MGGLNQIVFLCIFSATAEAGDSQRSRRRDCGNGWTVPGRTKCQVDLRGHWRSVRLSDTLF